MALNHYKYILLAKALKHLKANPLKNYACGMLVSFLNKRLKQ